VVQTTPGQGPQETTRVVCGHCGALTPADANAQCMYCGAGIRLLEPLAVDCGWCSASNRRDLTDTCRQCGGPLPSLPGGNPGPRPPDPPRQLPPGYPMRVQLWKNVFVLLGVVFVCCFFWAIIFPIIGAFLWIKGARDARNKLDALRDGVATRGRIASIQVDTTQHINRRHPWRIDYEYDTYDGPAMGACTAWDPSSVQRRIGDVLWVVFVPGRSEATAIWPPIR